jgi:hypothetical protein
MNKKLILIILGVLFLLFVLSNKSGYTVVPQRKTDQEVEVPSVADIANTSGACGMRPML